MAGSWRRHPDGTPKLACPDGTETPSSTPHRPRRIRPRIVGGCRAGPCSRRVTETAGLRHRYRRGSDGKYLRRSASPEPRLASPIPLLPTPTSLEGHPSAPAALPCSPTVQLNAWASVRSSHPREATTGCAACARALEKMLRIIPEEPEPRGRVRFTSTNRKIATGAYSRTRAPAAASVGDSFTLGRYTGR